ncbi:response regulator transcription factor [Novosphingobium sp. 9U]|uniref:response regulator transcription factor n=1 Tax=Novosphingobium sp. 9U TaxID=2653158 RepID=UPI0012EF8396|nr:LuxR C-terminal-related transcriptional regulator [Novosphingobium sp. 9U]VWX54861.1 LuxR family transcriptional regulator [Novosphingobium sp. 9U]
MKRYKTISLIDADFRRRAEHSKALAGSSFHIEPFESVEEFRHQGRADTLILVHDDGTAVADILEDMRTRDYWSPVLGYGKILDPVRCSQIILQGLVGYLPDPFDRYDIEALLEGASEQLTKLIDLRFGAADARQKIKTLTKREAQVLERLQAGLTNREIADSLEISPRTVEIHRANMLRKMDTKSALTAIRMSVQAKITG